MVAKKTIQLTRGYVHSRLDCQPIISKATV